MAEYRGLENAWRNPRTVTPKGKFLGMKPTRSPIRKKTRRFGRSIRGSLSFLYHHPEVRQAAHDIAGLALTYTLLKKMPNLRHRALNAVRRWRGGKAARTAGAVFSAKTVKRFLKRRR